MFTVQVDVAIVVVYMVSFVVDNVLGVHACVQCRHVVYSQFILSGVVSTIEKYNLAQPGREPGP